MQNLSLYVIISILDDLIPTEEGDFMDYNQLAVMIKSLLDAKILKTYDDFIANKDAGYYIKKTLKVTDSMTLEDIIAIKMQETLNNDNIDGSLKKYRHNRYVYKRNWFDTLKEEMSPDLNLKPRNPCSLQKEAELHFSLLKYSRNNAESEFSSIEEMMQTRFNEAEKWKSNPSALITDFRYYPDKTTSSQANAFVYDLILESLLIISNNFNGSLNGFLTKFPIELMDNPIFSYRTTTIDFEIEMIQNELRIFNDFEYDEGTLRIEVNKEHLDLPSEINTELPLEEILKKYNIQLSQRDMDMIDRELISCLFNMIDAEAIKSSHIVGDLKSLAKMALNTEKLRNTQLKDIQERLHKLRDYNYSVTVKEKKTGKDIEKLSMNLVSMVHTYEKNGLIFFDVEPTQRMISTYIKNNYVNILSQKYNQINSPQTRAILMILQSERIKVYLDGKLESSLSLKFFRSHMKLPKIYPAKLKKEIEKHLRILKEKNLVVQDYTIEKNGVNIHFTDLEDLEFIAYKIPRKEGLVINERKIPSLNNG